MIKINNMSKEAFKRLDSVLPDNWYAKDFKIEDLDTYNLTLSSAVALSKPSFSDAIYLAFNDDVKVAYLLFNEFSEIKII